MICSVPRKSSASRKRSALKARPSESEAHPLARPVPRQDRESSGKQPARHRGFHEADPENEVSDRDVGSFRVERQNRLPRPETRA